MISSALSKLIYSTKIINKEKLKVEEPCIYIANHTSLLDPFLLYAHLPDNVVFVANTGIAKKYAWAMKGKEVITVDPMNPYSIRDMIRVVKSGKSIAIFPEGRITVTNSLMKIYSGVAFIAMRTGAKLLPIAINGAEKAKGLTYLDGKIPTKLCPDVSLYVGEPFNIDKVEGISISKQKDMGSHIIYRKLQELILESRMIKSVNLVEELRKRVQEAPDMTILEDMSSKLTMKELWNKVVALSYMLKSKIKEDRVGILLPTSIANVSTLFAVLYNGKSPAMLNVSMDVKTQMSCLSTGDIKSIVTSKVFIEKAKLKPLIEACKDIINFIYLEDVAEEINTGTKINVLLNRNKEVTSPTNDIILFTSGSEGTPKGVLLTHENIYANVQQARLMIDFTSKDTIIHALPMFHSFGMILSFVSTLCHVPAVLVPSPLLYRVIPEITYDKKGTILFGTSTFLQNYGKYAHPYDFNFLRYVFCGGEKLQDHVYDLWIEKFGIRICEGYGLTETAPILSIQSKLLFKKGSVGCFVPGVKYELEKVEGIDEGGKLKIQAPNLMKGYLISEKGFVKTPEWFDTGDIVTIDEKGFVTIQGRSKQFVKIGGEMVSLSLVEDNVKKALGIDVVVAVGIADMRKGERIEVAVSIKEKNIDFSKIKEYWKTNSLSPLSIPSRLHVLEAIPLLGSGKIDKVSVKKQIEKIYKDESEK